MAKLKKPTRGGARKGAGRKPLGDAKRITIHPTIAPGTLDRIAALGFRWGLASGQVIDRLAHEAHPEDPDQ